MLATKWYHIEKGMATEWLVLNVNQARETWHTISEA